MGIFSSKPIPLAIVPTDTIVSLNATDDISINRSMILDILLRYDDVLDAEKLHSSLETLLTIGNWRKLGARLRLNKAGKLEYHIPAYFGPSRPAVAYSHVQYKTLIEEHPVASKLPKATVTPSLHPNASEFMSLSRTPNTPTKIEDYLYTDRPQLCLHIVSFTNATLVSLSWPHTLFDAMGRAALFSAWALVLNGQASEVPEVCGFNADPLATVGINPKEKSVLEHHRLNRLYFVFYVINYLLESILHPREATHTICLPASTVATLKTTALAELSRDPSIGEAPFLSDGDIISAWWFRVSLEHLPQTSKRNAVLLNAFGIRGVMAKEPVIIPSNKVYIGNCVQACYTVIPLSSLLTKPLSWTAHQIRRSIIEQGTRDQIEAVFAMHKGSGIPPIFGGINSIMVIISNWSKAKFYDLDFSAAIVPRTSSSEKRLEGIGKPTYIHHLKFGDKYSARYSGPIYGKDGEGNYWLSGTLRTESWEGVVKALEKLDG